MEYAVIKKISCYFISCTVMFEKCKNLVYMNEYGTESKTNISAYGFGPNKSIIWYFIHECLFRLMKGMHKTGWTPCLKLQWSYLQAVYGIIPTYLFGQLSNLTWIKILITENVWLFVYLYVTAHAPAQQSYLKVHSLLRYGSHTHF